MSRALLLLLAVAASAACPRPEPPPPPSPGPQCATSACTSDRDCPPVGATRSFCSGAGDDAGCCRPGDLCTSDRECVDGAECNIRRGLCERPCFADECGLGELCLLTDGDAFCGVPGAADECVVATSLPLVAHGAAFRIEALGTDTRGAVLPAAAVAWEATNADIVGSNAAVGQCTGATICEARLTATVGNASCAATVRVLPPSSDRRVAVVDASTGSPIEGVRVDLEIDGAFVTLPTDAEGLVTVTGIADVVTAMPDGYEWHTVLEPSGDVVIMTERLSAEVSGVKGFVDFSEVHTQGDIRLAWTGLALRSLTEVKLADVVGDVSLVDIELEGVTTPGGDIVAWPSALVLMLGDNPIRPEWVAFGTSPLSWTIGGQVPLAEIGAPLGGSTSFVTDLLRASAPFVERFDHGVENPSIARGPAPARDEDGSVSFAEWPFEELIVEPDVVMRHARELVVSADEPDILLVALARVPVRGFVPLGVGINTQDLRYATLHDGLEGYPVTFAAVSLDLDELLGDLSVRAAFGDAPSFTPHVDASFDGVALTATHDDSDGADVYRVRFDGTGGAWTITSASAPSFVVDELHAGDVDTSARTTSARVEAVRGTLDEPTAIASRPID